MALPAKDLTGRRIVSGRPATPGRPIEEMDAVMIEERTSIHTSQPPVPGLLDREVALRLTVDALERHLIVAEKIYLQIEDPHPVVILHEGRRLEDGLDHRTVQDPVVLRTPNDSETFLPNLHDVRRREKGEFLQIEADMTAFGRLREEVTPLEGTLEGMTEATDQGQEHLPDALLTTGGDGHLHRELPAQLRTILHADLLPPFIRIE